MTWRRRKNRQLKKRVKILREITNKKNLEDTENKKEEKEEEEKRGKVYES